MKFSFFMSVIFFFVAEINAQSIYNDTVRIYYEIDISDISKKGEETIDSVAVLMKNDSSISCNIIGYADFLADKTYNLHLSKRRVRMVKKLLLTKGVSSEAIQKSTGKGELAASGIETPLGEQKSRRVDIIISHTDTFYISKKSNIEDITTLDVGQTLILENMYFLPGKHLLREISKPVVKRLLKILEENPALKIEIQGHICCENGNHDGYDWDTGEYKLSENRAKYIYDFLVASNIDSSRLRYKGFARTRPLVKIERTEEDENKNRRVEIMIIGK